MLTKLNLWLKQKIAKWLMHEHKQHHFAVLSDFNRVLFEIRPCDILLIEGRSRISNVISVITRSPWTHACMYLGKLHDIGDLELRKFIQEKFRFNPEDHLIIESILGEGTVIKSINIYQNEHIRICRPTALSMDDAKTVISFVIGRVGLAYDVRHIIDLARFLLPWSIFPRRWRSSLFSKQPGAATRQICSSMLAEAFMSVHYPILPIIKKNSNKKLKLYEKNHRLFTPSDFDYSPFFDIIKYPILELQEHPAYTKVHLKEDTSEL